MRLSRSAGARSFAVLASLLLFGSSFLGQYSARAIMEVPVSFIAFGDAGNNSTAQRALASQMRARSADYDFAVLTGDGAYPDGAYNDYTTKFFDVYGDLYQAQGQAPAAPTRTIPKPLMTSLGNHGYDTPNATGYRDSFVMPENGPSGVPFESFFTFDVGGVHFVSFDSHLLVGWNMSTPQVTMDLVRDWLVADLNANFNKVTVVFDHHPAYTAGAHRSDLEPAAMARDWFPLFATNGVDLFLSATPTPTPGAPGSVHVADLDGTSRSSGSTWQATVTATVDNATHQRLSGATLSGTWSGGYTATASCVTSSSGSCTITSGSIPKKNASATFTVTGITYPTLVYDPAANHDPDGDTNGTRVSVSKP